MKRISRIFAILIVQLIVFSANLHAEFPGVSPGGFSVSDSGSANYSVAISTPAGIAGMSPELSINYSSSGGNGMLGVGFQLSGFSSSIHRCGGSHLTDGRASGVTYTNSDKLCLDGQRLVIVKGTPWTNGAEYRTEIESYSRIQYVKSSTTSPGHFRVYTRDGELHWYNTPVKGMNNDPTVLRWLKNAEQDRSGNLIRYYYQHINGEHWLPKEVYWTGKGPDKGTRKAVFTFKPRQDDKRMGYDYGAKREYKHVLDKITTYIDETKKIKQYQFEYQKAPVSGLSRLISIQQSGRNGTKLPAHRFDWYNTARGFIPNTPYKLPVRVYDNKDGSAKNGTQTGDFIDVNNDGLVDYVVSYKDYATQMAHHAIYQNTGTKWQHLGQNKPPQSFVMRDHSIKGPSGNSDNNKMIQQGVYTDVNGDGYPDIVRAYSIVHSSSNTEIKKEVWLNNRKWGWDRLNQFTPPTVLSTYSRAQASKANTSIDTDQFGTNIKYNNIPMNKATLTDINGDGLVDWVVAYRSFKGVDRTHVWLNNRSKWVLSPGYKLPTTMVFDDYLQVNSEATGTISKAQLVDLNGDGLDDLIKSVKYKSGQPETLKQENEAWLNTGSGWTKADQFKAPDLITDYTQNKVQGGGTRDFLAQTRGSFVDVNGDGLVDWVRSYKSISIGNPAYKYTWLNTGKDWVPNTNYNLPGAVMNNYSHDTGGRGGHPSGSFFDINRDGLVDWVVAHRNFNGDTVKHTYLNKGTGWHPVNKDYEFPNILIDNKKFSSSRMSLQYGGLMDLNNDGAVDYLMSSKLPNGTPVVNTYMGKAKPADILWHITDSLGAETRVYYKPMSDKTVYAQLIKSQDFRFSRQNVIGPTPLVSNTATNNGLSDSNGQKQNYWLRYHYYNAISHGRDGNMGFGQRRIWDPHQLLMTIQDYHQSYSTAGMVREKRVYKADDVNTTGGLTRPVLLNFESHKVSSKRETHTTASGKKTTYSPAIGQTRMVEFELTGTTATPIRTIWMDTVYGAYRNPTQVTTVIKPGNSSTYGYHWGRDFRKIIQTSYQNNEANWLIGMPTRVKVTHSAPNQADQKRTTSTTYNDRGLPANVIVEPGKEKFKLTTTYGYDGRGNQIESTVSGQGITARTSKVVYDPAGLHVLKKENPLKQTITIVPDPYCDAPRQVTNANGHTTTTHYDEFCRVRQINNPNGTASNMKYYTNPYRTLETATAKPNVFTYYDLLGRVNGVRTLGFDGHTVISQKKYNAKGQVTHESQPYFSGETIRWTQYAYDVIGRLYQTTTADNKITKIKFNGLDTTTTNALGQAHTVTKDLQGRTIQVKDALNKSLTYDYDAVGNLLKTTDAKGNEVKMGYDHIGNKKWMADPDMGRWTYDYDVLGQLIKQTDAKGNVITTDYDILGRLIKRVTRKASASIGEVSKWVYDSADNGVGLLDTTTGPDGYKRSHTYDHLSRPARVFETIKGKQSYSLTTYNSIGQIAEVRPPAAVNSVTKGGQPRLVHHYNIRGYLTHIEEVKRVNGIDEYKIVWKANEADAKGNITKERYGNGVNINRSYHPTRNYLRSINSRLGPTPIQNLSYTMDAIGNLTKRENILTGARENFTYDRLNRLKKSKTTLPNKPVKEVTYEYDALGNIKYRSDVGTLTYGERGFGPHAVTSIRKTGSNVIPENTYNPYGNYRYDANGNLVQNGQRTVEWTAFNKPKQMAGFVNNEARGMSYEYGSDLQRIYKRTMNGEKTIRYYASGASERINEDSKVFWKFYLPIGAATLEIKYREFQQNGQANFNQVEKQYLFKDHLGSTDVIVDHQGIIKEQLSFNPWGERRDADWTEADTEIESSTTRGFTGHEMDDEIGLVNMNARIYDPVIGRFLSPDSLIPSPTDMQSYNRYSYVRNNPLSFTDPSGNMRVPGTGGYYSENGSYYKNRYYRDCKPGECRGSGASWNVEKIKITDPGMKNHLNTRVGVAHEIIKNYGGLSRGNTKETRNKYRAQAAAIVGCSNCSAKFLNTLRGHSAEFDSALDKAAAAGDIYVQLKRQARSRYKKLAFNVAATALTMGATVASNAAIAAGATAGTGAALTQTQLAVLYGGSALVASGGDVKAAVVAAASAGVVGPGLSKLNGIKQIAAHGVWGGVSSEILGGGFTEGFAGAAFGKAVTVGSASAFGVSQGDFHLGHFGVTVAGGALAAELAGGDAAYGAGVAAVGYMINQLGSYSADSLKGQANLAESKQATLQGQIDSSLTTGKNILTNSAAVGCFSVLAVCTQGSRIPGAIINPHTPYPYACALSTACTVGEVAYKGLIGEL